MLAFYGGVNPPAKTSIFQRCALIKLQNENRKQTPASEIGGWGYYYCVFKRILIRCIRQQSHMARGFNRRGDGTLVHGARSAHTTGKDFPAVRSELFEL